MDENGNISNRDESQDEDWYAGYKKIWGLQSPEPEDIEYEIIEDDQE